MIDHGGGFYQPDASLDHVARRTMSHAASRCTRRSEPSQQDGVEAARRLARRARARYARAAAIMRARLAAVMLARAPPKARERRRSHLDEDRACCRLARSGRSRRRRVRKLRATIVGPARQVLLPRAPRRARRCRALSSAISARSARVGRARRRDRRPWLPSRTNWRPGASRTWPVAPSSSNRSGGPSLECRGYAEPRRGRAREARERRAVEIHAAACR